MTLKECYEKIGGNYDDILNRLFKEELVSRFLIKFLDDTSYSLLLEGIEKKDGEIAFRAAHTLKGVALNLGLTSVFKPTEALTEVLRNGWNDEALTLLPPVTEAYESAIRIIKEWQNQ